MRNRTGLPAALGAGLAVFVALWVLVAVRWAPLLTFDHRAVTDAHALSLGHAWLRTLSLIVTDLGSPVAVDVVAAVAVVVAAVRRWLPAAVAITVARLGELGTETAVKVLVDRSRPVLAHPLATGSGYSFPSGHTAGSAALYGVLVLLALPVVGRRWQVTVATVGVVFVLAVVASRVLLGVHYPSDVVAGLALGLVWAVVAVLVSERPAFGIGTVRLGAGRGSPRG